MDQPLYAMAKEIQWNHPDKLGEDTFVLMMGGLHTEIALLKILGTVASGEWLVEHA